MCLAISRTLFSFRSFILRSEALVLQYSQSPLHQYIVSSPGQRQASRVPNDHNHRPTLAGSPTSCTTLPATALLLHCTSSRVDPAVIGITPRDGPSSSSILRSKAKITAFLALYRDLPWCSDCRRIPMSSETRRRTAARGRSFGGQAGGGGHDELAAEKIHGGEIAMGEPLCPIHAETSANASHQRHIRPPN